PCPRPAGWAAGAAAPAPARAPGPVCASRRHPGGGERRGDELLRLRLEPLEMVRAREALGVDLVDVLGARRPRREPAALGHDLDPPKGAPLPAASPWTASTRSPASSVARTSSGRRRFRTSRCALSA